MANSNSSVLNLNHLEKCNPKQNMSLNANSDLNLNFNLNTNAMIIGPRRR